LRVIFKEFIMTVLEVDSEKADQMLEAGKKWIYLREKF
jgi:hypothetical protein